MRGLGPAIILLIVIIAVGSAAVAAHSSAAAGAAGKSNNAIIPDESIRIRIIAQSDDDEDQATKRAVQARVSALIESWGEMPATIEEARKLIRSHLPDVRKATDRVLKQRGAGYGAKVELGTVPFPDKTFEGEKYPAGDYEALRITLGQGEGANWWCVLFPPLCLTAATAKEDADGSAAAGSAAKTPEASAKNAKVSSCGNDEAAAGTAVSAGVKKVSSKTGDSDDKPKTEFFLVVLLKKLFAWLASLFA